MPLYLISTNPIGFRHYRPVPSMYPPYPIVLTPREFRNLIGEERYPKYIRLLYEHKRVANSSLDLNRRVQLLYSLNRALNDLFGNDARLRLNNITNSFSGSSNYNPQTNTITLTGRISLITYLHEYAHSLYENLYEFRLKASRLNLPNTEYFAVAFSVTSFYAVMPTALQRLQIRGHCLVRRI